MAQGMLDATTHLNTPMGDPLHIRVTVNTGPAAAGIVGAKVPRYSFFGETVNAFGMCMEPVDFPVGCVHVSSRTHDALRDSGNAADFRFHPLESVGKKRSDPGSSRRLDAKSGPNQESSGRQQDWLLEYGYWEAALKAQAIAASAKARPRSLLSKGRSSYQDLKSAAAKEGELEKRLEPLPPKSTPGSTSGGLKKQMRGTRGSGTGNRSGSFRLLQCMSPPKDGADRTAASQQRQMMA